MTTLLAVERIKLFTTRSPWWCSVIALAVTIGFGALFVNTGPTQSAVTVAGTQLGYTFGLVVVMVMAALAVTTEYRFGTIRATFQAIPNRGAVLLAKTALVALLAAGIGELAAFGSWGAATLLKPATDLTINTAFEWRAVAGTGLIYALAAVVAVCVGVLIRQSAGAISVVLIYTQLVEPLVQMVPNVGSKIHQWLPFNVAHQFLTGNPDVVIRQVDGPGPSDATIGPWWALAYFTAFAAVLLIAALVTARNRDA
jgi:ABC-2 type transport system permease protein